MVIFSIDPFFFIYFAELLMRGSAGLENEPGNRLQNKSAPIHTMKTLLVLPKPPSTLPTVLLGFRDPPPQVPQAVQSLSLHQASPIMPHQLLKAILGRWGWASNFYTILPSSK